jgi:murein DD-endopeptidase MepM/ murein hydrolase activator NlpD
MPKEKYTLDPHSLQYDQIEKSWNKRLYSILLYILSIFVTSVIIFFFSSMFIDTPKEGKINQKLSELKENYKILNKKYNEYSVVLNDLKKLDKNIYRLIFEAEPISEENILNQDIKISEEALEKLDSKEVNEYTQQELKEITKELNKLSKLYDEIWNLTLKKLGEIKYMPAIFPIKMNNLNKIAGVYGNQIHPILKTKKFHEGIDFAGKVGEPIYSTADGKVVAIKKNSSKGLYVKIEHRGGYATIYAHCDKIMVKRGRKVKRGQVIAKMGNSGKSFDPHLHYEVLKDGKTVDPKFYFYNDLNSNEYNKLLRLTENIGQAMD